MRFLNFKSITTIIICFLAYGLSQGQVLTKESIKYQYDDEIPKQDSEFGEIHVKKGKQIQVNFDCCFEDTIELYVNSVLIDRIYLQTEAATSFTNYSKLIDFEKHDKKTILKMIIPNKSIYCEIELDKNYKILHVNRLENSNIKWWIIFRNFEITYE